MFVIPVMVSMRSPQEMECDKSDCTDLGCKIRRDLVLGWKRCFKMFLAQRVRCFVLL